MSWQVVGLAEVAPTPWRNGGGVTRELAAWPSGADWNWRMSVAEVERSGPFSQFDGIERWFAVVSGAGVELENGVQKHRVLAGGPPLQFDGAAATNCSLIAGSTRDFNLMVRQSRASSRMARVGDGVDMRLVASPSSPKTLAVYAIGGAAKIRLDGEPFLVPEASLAWRRVTSAALFNVSGSEALWMEITT